VIVVSNTSPICYSVMIGEADLLARLYGKVVISQTVLQELSVSRTPEQVRDWVKHLPDWLEVKDDAPTSLILPRVLQAGEASAIVLAKNLRADVLILDDRAARRVATAHGLTVVGLLGLLILAHRSGQTDARLAIRKLRQTSFFVTDDLLTRLSQEHGIALL